MLDTSSPLPVASKNIQTTTSNRRQLQPRGREFKGRTGHWKNRAAATGRDANPTGTVTWRWHGHAGNGTMRSMIPSSTFDFLGKALGLGGGQVEPLPLDPPELLALCGSFFSTLTSAKGGAWADGFHACFSSGGSLSI